MNYHTILITGGAGFIGSNLAIFFKQKYPSVKVIALDNLKRRGSELNLPRLKENGVEFVHGDIRAPEDLVLNTKVDLLIECSAEPSVLSGLDNNPLYIINTNLTGTINCLELARKNKADVVFLSTSRVYPYAPINNIKTKELGTRFDWVEAQKISGWSKNGINMDFTTCGPKTFYGATKLASELLLQEYIVNYGIKAVINRCGVIAGPWQFGKVDQGIFTFWMLAHYFKKSINYIGFGGKGKQVRDILHVQDLFELVDLEIAAMNKISGNIYNVGGSRDGSLSLLETTKLCEQITGNRLKIGSDKTDRPGDIKIYLSDNAKVKKDLSWQPKKSPEETLLDIYTWINNNEKQIKSSL
ncbi:MAG: NAD-dependent epimerase/dehydratase family protein [Candidatus Omnitrophota bacterium]